MENKTTDAIHTHVYIWTISVPEWKTHIAQIKRMLVKSSTLTKKVNKISRYYQSSCTSFQRENTPSIALVRNHHSESIRCLLTFVFTYLFPSLSTFFSCEQFNGDAIVSLAPGSSCTYSQLFFGVIK